MIPFIVFTTSTFAVTFSEAVNILQKHESIEAMLGKSKATAQEAELKGVEEYAIECSILKVAVSEDIQNCSDEGIQIFGGMGFSKESPMEAAWRDARITRIYEGTNEINRLLAVSMLLKKALKGEIDIMTPALAIRDELLEISSFEKV